MRSTVLLVAFSAMSVLACGGDDTTDPPTDNGTPIVASVVVTPGNATLVSLGETVQLTASARDASGNTISGKTFTWSSSGMGIATVSSSGLVTAVANGSVTITATSGNASGTGTVTVEQVAAAVVVSPSSVELTGPGDVVTLAASVVDAGGSAIVGPGLTWASEAPAIATVSALGTVTGEATGTTTVTATSQGESGSATVVVAGPATNGLRVFYPFADDANDESGNGFNGTLLGGATATGALTIAANNTDRLSVPSSVANGLGDFTVAAWVRLDVVQPSSNELVSGATAGEDNSWTMWYGVWQPAPAPPVAEGRWALTLGGSPFPFPTHTVIEDGEWHHVAYLREGSLARFYFDGVQVGPDITVPGSPAAIAAGGFIIGQDQDVVGGGFDASQSLGGQVDNFRVYNRALSLPEVRALSTEAR